MNNLDRVKCTPSIAQSYRTLGDLFYPCNGPTLYFKTMKCINCKDERVTYLDDNSNYCTACTYAITLGEDVISELED